MASANQRLSAETVVNALRVLMGEPFGRTGRAALIGYLALKSRETSPGQPIDIRSTGPGSVQQELDRFFSLAPGSQPPYVNPFGLSQGRLEWLGEGYERRGVYTHLDPSRTLERFLQVQTVDTHRIVTIPSDAAQYIAGKLGRRVPLEPASCFLLRGESFQESATREDVVERFQGVFHLSDRERDALFVSVPSFAIGFDEVGFSDAVNSLPPDLHPPSPTAGHAGATFATQTLATLAPPQIDTLVFDDPVLRRARRALARDTAIAIFGPPGTGKSSLVEKLVTEAGGDPDRFGLSRPPDFDRYTAETDWTARTIIGGYFPQESGRLVFQEGYLLTALRRNRWLILDEMNRADLDRILGAVLTFLAGQSTDLGKTDLTSEGKPMLLSWGTEPDSGVLENETERLYVAGTDWRIIGTYNSVDIGRVFSMGSALSRRWATIPVPPLGTEHAGNVIEAVRGLPHGVAQLLKRVYDLHLKELPLGIAPFIDMARFVADEQLPDPPTGAVPDAVTSTAREYLRDAYVLYLGPQLRRLDPESREAFLDGLGAILGMELSDELRRL